MSAGSPAVSFVVLSYNFGRYLRDCLDSILAQDSGDLFEVIVVDDASTDGSAAVVSTYDDPRIRLIRHETNAGHIATVHDGLAAARGGFIARIDGDDRYRPQFLREALPVFSRFADVGVVYGEIALINERGEITQEPGGRRPRRLPAKGNVLIPLLEENFICSATVIARREAWQRALPVPAGLAFHDWYFTLMMSREWECYYVDRVLADYRVHPENMHRAIVREKTGEPTIFWLLDRIYGEAERHPQLEAAKRAARRRIYGAQYLSLADKYFWFQMDADARRCYLQAIRQRPGYLLRPGVLRRLAATYLGRQAYERSKSFVKTVLRPIR